MMPIIAPPPPSVNNVDHLASQIQNVDVSSNLTQILTSLTSKSHLERDRAVKSFRLHIPSATSTEQKKIRSILVARLNDSTEWQTIHSTVTALCHYLTICFTANEADKQEDEQLIETLQSKVDFLISHLEARVRESSTLYISTICKIAPQTTFTKLYPLLLKKSEETFELDIVQRSKEAAKIAARDVKDQSAGNIKEKYNLLHETEGWKGLETILLCQSSLVSNCDKKTLEEISEIIECIQKSNLHPNRFVREAGFKLLNSCILNINGKELVQFIQLVLNCLKLGLQDNWSQVRFQSSLCIRSIIVSLPFIQFKEFFPVLLPRMCLNRHYVAEGVRNYSHDTWKILFSNQPSTSGKAELVLIIDKVIEFFKSQTSADNHAVREAACQSFGEIILRLDESVMKDYVFEILNALLDGFKDESWPVRDCACAALSEVMKKYSSEVTDKNELLEEIFQLFTKHLSDNILSVRKNCSVSFIKACSSYDLNHPVMGYNKLIPIIKEHLYHINIQKNDVNRKPMNNPVKNTFFGASTVIAQDAHATNQTMFSCGSLAPKLRRGGGCSDHGFVRPREQWEITEGGILLWSALVTEGGKDGIDIANQLVKRVLETGVVISEKPFRAKPKLMITLVESIVTVLSAKGIEFDKDDEELVSNVVRILDGAKHISSHALKESSHECRRMTMRMVGLRRFMDLEKEYSLKQ